MKSVFCLLALALALLPMSAEAKTTRVFSGKSPAEVKENAKEAGYDYPDGEMECSFRCHQRWAKE